MIRSLIVVSLVLLGGLAARAQSTITNVKSAQVPGTHTVKITYDLSASASRTISVQASDDGGANYGLTLPPDALSGDVGAKYYNAGTRTIVLDASKVDQLKSTFTKDLRFKVVASGVAVLGQMVFIPGGTFQMGNSFAGEGYSGEVPVHSVTVDAFYLQNTEVTKAQWDAVRDWGAAAGRGYTDLPVGSGKAANYPVHSITWYAMVKYCNARSQMENLTPCYTVGGVTYKTGSSAPDCNWNASGYRLPTEAEWERAARGGQSGKRFPWGDTITHSLANYHSSASYAYDVSPTRDYHPTYNDGVSPYTSPVGSFPPTGHWQLYDMSGNVWEWCWDWYAGSYYTSSPGTDPRGPASGSYRVFRGGSWFLNFYGQAFGCRTAFRGNGGPDGNFFGSGTVGFRPARSSVPQ